MILGPALNYKLHDFSCSVYNPTILFSQPLGWEPENEGISCSWNLLLNTHCDRFMPNRDVVLVDKSRDYRLLYLSCPSGCDGYSQQSY